MRESFTYKGLWFLPNIPDKKVAGILSYDQNKGIRLELIGSFQGYNESREFKYEDIILGYTNAGKLITLYECHSSGVTMSHPGIMTLSWDIIFILSGAHFNSTSELEFHTIAGSLFHLSEWLSIPIFKLNTKAKNENLNIKHKKVKPIEFNVNDKLNGKLNFTYKIPLGYQSELKLEQKVEFILESNSESSVPFKTLLSNIWHFQNFLTLGTYETSYPLSIRLRSQNISRSISRSINDEYTPKDIYLFFRLSIERYPRRQKVLREFLFNYKDIKTSFKKIIQLWYQNQENLAPVNSILLESFYRSDSFNENKFLNMVQALESFHRRTRNNIVIPEKEHKDRLTEIKKSVDPKHLEWLNSRFIHSNEPSLQKRLEDLTAEFSTQTFRRIVTDTPTFIKQTKDSRNYYTHFDKSMEKKALKGGDLFYLTEKLKVVLVCAILKESGFSHKLIEKLLLRNEYNFFNHILH